MILCDREILEAIQEGRIVIEPGPDESLMSSTSIDLTLAASLEQWHFLTNPEALSLRFRPAHPGWSYEEVKGQYLQPVRMNAENAYDLKPNAFVLGWTQQRIYLPHSSRLCARVEGKSSLARLGLGVHVTAPTIHAGFGFNKKYPDKSGAPLQLEIWNTGPLPIELKQALRICQVIVEEVRERPSIGYQGRFNLQGPQPPSGSKEKTKKKK